MTSRSERLKRLILVAVVYHRLKELHFIPEKLSNLWKIDFTVGDPSGRDGLVEILKEFFQNRVTDNERPVSQTSTFLLDVATILALLETPGVVFEGAAKQAALMVLGRVMRFEGWHIRPDKSAVWKTTFESVDPQAVEGAVRANMYCSLLKNNWVYDGAPMEDVFDPEENW